MAQINKVVRLSDHQNTRVVGGYRYPTLYRVTGRYWEVGEGGEAVPGEVAFPDYALSPGEHQGLAEAQAEPITELDPAIDKGWVIVRAHPNMSYYSGYIDATIDLSEYPWSTPRAMFQTSEGIFTVIWRPARPNCKDHLLIYITGDQSGDDRVSVIEPDGTVHEDDDLIHPPDE